MDAVTLEFLIQDGVATGAIYVLVSVALLIVFLVTRVIFVPQGELISYSALASTVLMKGEAPPLLWFLLAAGVIALLMDLQGGQAIQSAHGLARAVLLYVGAPLAIIAGAYLSIRVGAPVWSSMVLGGAISIAFGPILYRIAFEPLSSASPLTLLIAAIALHYVLLGIGLYCFGAQGVRTPGIAGDAFELGAVPITFQFVLIIASCTGICAALWLFFEKTIYGKSLRATAVNHRGARLVGISPQYAGKLAFSIAGLIAVFCAYLIGPVNTLYYDSGFYLGLKGFVATILGGLASYPLTAVGSILLGTLESFSSFWASAFKDAIVFSMILVILLGRTLSNPTEVRDEMEY